MRKLMRTTLACVAVGATIASLAAPVLGAPPVRDGGKAAPHADNRSGPLTARQEARRKEAMELILSGKKAPNEDGVVALAGDKYYQAAVTGTGHVFTILAEFGDQGSGKLGTVPGPLHNQIPKPNRPVVDGQANASYDPAKPFDNSTIWTSNFNRAHYLDLFFGGEPSFAHFYQSQSSGAYTVAGDVTDWVQVPGNASTYGDNTVEDFGGTWQFLDDAADAWFVESLKSMTTAQINAYLAQFDVWDRYDHDNDGNFDEPDGYIDHFQAVHAGEGEESGGGAQGTDAIWSHRWYANIDYGTTGPSNDALFGGVHIGNSNYWIGDYTVENENGGLGVFAHEFGHDLGLPDLYDTKGGENGVAFWSLMSVGSYLGDGTEDTGTRPGYMGPWERLQLGWLDYSVVNPGESDTFRLAPSSAVIADIEDVAVPKTWNTPAGGHAWWTGNANDLVSTLTRTVDLTGVSSASLTASAWYSIEEGYDYLYVDYSTDGGATWTSVGDPLDGSSNGRWAGLRYTIPGGAQTLVRFRYDSDTGTNLGGAFLDDITIKSGGTTILPTDTVENGANGWTAAGGFVISDGQENVIGDRYYLAENRTYVGYDAGLRTGPYQFSFAMTDPDKVEHFAFEDGLLVWLVDESYSDNDVTQHLGHGQTLPVDARPTPFAYADGTRPSNRRQPFDATFGLQAVPAGPTADPEGGTLPCAGLHKQYNAGTSKVPVVGYYCAWPTAAQRAAIAMFDDSVADRYWTSANPQNSTKTPGSGVTMEVTGQRTGSTLTVEVVNPAP